MAVVDATALPAGIDRITPTDNRDHSTKLASSVSTIQQFQTDEHQPQGIEAIHLDEGNVTARTKIRTLAIVSALYVVLFIAALDQTIIASGFCCTIEFCGTYTYN